MITVGSTSGVPTVEVGVLSGPKGNPGPPGGAVFEFEQTDPAMVWTVDHNLGAWPHVIVYDAAGDEIVAHIENPTINRSTITFSAAIAGKARFS